MGTKKQQQNNEMRKIIFDISFNKDPKSQYTSFKIDDEMATLGSIDALNPNNSLESVPDEIKNSRDYSSYVIGFEHTRRLLKIQNDLYEMGKEYFAKGILIEEIPQNYKNNEHFMAGYNDAKISSLGNNKRNSGH